jgi:hypothetical protein
VTVCSIFALASFREQGNMVLRNKTRRRRHQGTYAFYDWIWNSLAENKPRLVVEIMTASRSRLQPGGDLVS